jgi:hypothetical protein
MHKAMKFVFASVVCSCFLCSLVGCRTDRVEWSYASLADVKKADAGAQSWVPDDLLPASAHSIRIAGELSPSYEWGSFDFVPADSQAIVNSLRSVDVLPQSVKSVRNPRVSWWPSLLIGTLNVEKIRAAGFQLFAVEKAANSVDTTVFLFALDLSKGHGFFYSTYKSR